jgi:hypothetical protein
VQSKASYLGNQPSWRDSSQNSAVGRSAAPQLTHADFSAAAQASQYFAPERLSWSQDGQRIAWSRARFLSRRLAGSEAHDARFLWSSATFSARSTFKSD